MYRLIAALLLGIVTLTACAQPSQPSSNKTSTTPTNATPANVQQRVTAALNTLDPDFKPDYIGAAPFPGFREVVVSGQILYVSDNGRYLIQAQPYDIQNKNLLSAKGCFPTAAPNWPQCPNRNASCSHQRTPNTPSAYSPTLNAAIAGNYIAKLPN